MSSITMSFFATSSFSFRYPVSLSRLKLLPISLFLVATPFSSLQVFMSRPGCPSLYWVMCRDLIFMS